MQKLQLRWASSSVGSNLVEKQSGPGSSRGIHKCNGNCGLLNSNLQALANLLFDLKRGLEPAFSSVFSGERRHKDDAGGDDHACIFIYA